MLQIHLRWRKGSYKPSKYTTWLTVSTPRRVILPTCSHVPIYLPSHSFTYHTTIQQVSQPVENKIEEEEEEEEEESLRRKTTPKRAASKRISSPSSSSSQ
jgi:hypothetical protein